MLQLISFQDETLARCQDQWEGITESEKWQMQKVASLLTSLQQFPLLEAPHTPLLPPKNNRRPGPRVPLHPFMTCTSHLSHVSAHHPDIHTYAAFPTTQNTLNYKKNL